MTNRTMRVPFTVPPFVPEVKQAVSRVIESGWVTTGPESVAFEHELAAYLGQPNVVAVASCTQALELSLRALRLPPGSRVMTPSLTFCGAVAAIVHAGYQPVLVDIDENSFVPTPETVARAARRVNGIDAMTICDLAGYPVDHVALADAASLTLDRIVVDAAHGPGGSVGRAAAGTAPFATCLSFYATKNLPIGEGGAVATFDDELAAWLRSARLHGMSKDAWRRYLPGGSWRYDVPEPGFKANLTDLQAAIGRVQLEALPRWQDERAAAVKQYDDTLSSLIAAGQVRIPERPEGHSFHLYQVRVARRDAVIDSLTAHGIGTSVHFIPAHQFGAYSTLLGPAECAAVPVTDFVAEELLSLPLYPGLSSEQIDIVCDRLAKSLQEGR